MINKRVQKLIDYFRENSNGDSNNSKEIISNAKLIITSRNTFPTAAGCASSASSMSCLVRILSKLFNNNLNDTILSHLSRQASGSACRSIYGGIVEWVKNDEYTGLSVAKQLADCDYWDIRILLLIVSDKRKDIGSTEGMKISKETSSFLKVNKQ
jgi:diphosphomevalonate decarboxylase